MRSAGGQGTVAWPDGLSLAEAERRLAAEGPNELPTLRRPSLVAQLARQFTHLLAILLWVASGLALLAGQPPLAIAIVIVVVLNALFAFAQELRADRSAERLQNMLPLTARVRREGMVQRIAPNRWRLVLPRPRFESMLDVIELTPRTR